jgi:hypothetical protein
MNDSETTQEPSMWKQTWRCLVALILVALIVPIAVVGIGGLRHPKKLNSTKAVDETLLTVQAVAYGTNEVSVNVDTSKSGGMRILNSLQRALRLQVQSHLSSDFSNGLFFAVTQQNPSDYSYLRQLDCSRIRCVSKGAVLETFVGTRTWNGIYMYSLPVFPRREREFTVQLIRRQTNSIFAELTISNPLPQILYPEWHPRQLPQTETNGSVVVTLKKIIQDQNNSPNVTCRCIYHVDSVDPAWKGTQKSQHWFSDATGNTGDYLFTNEMAWKLHLNLYRHDEAEFPSNVVWRLPMTPVPSATNFIRINQSNVLDGVPIEVSYFCGKGKLVISNQVYVSMHPSHGSGYGMSRNSRRTVESYSNEHPFIILEAPHLSDSDRLMVRCRGKNGKLLGVNNIREIASVIDLNGKRIERLLYSADYLDGYAGEIQMELVLSHPKRFDFLVKPPQPL